ncbi:MAG TPA: glycosyl hydrolase family 65 protein [Burkholderiaceae bacterium]
MQQKHRRRHTFPLDPWGIRETGFDTDSHFLDETLFALGNGYIGLRGSHEETYTGPKGSSRDGSYLNGFYDTEEIHYPENAYGLARLNEFMLNVPNGKRIECFIEGERVDLLQGEVADYERALDFRRGIVERRFEWVSPQGRRIAISSRRIVCLAHKHLYGMQYQVRAMNFSGRVRLVSILDGAVKNLEAGDDPRVGSTVHGPSLHLLDLEQEGGYAALIQRTTNSGFTLVSAIESELSGASGTIGHAVHGQRIETLFDCDLARGGSAGLVKFGCYFSSRDFPEAELASRARETLREARLSGFDALCAEQEAWLADFWKQADVEIAGDDALQQGMRFNQFHLLQSVGRDGKSNIAAKGVTGEGYEGHYFWDTEIYILPFFLYSKPDVARKLLEYRYAGLPKARERARQMAHGRGALYPWRTIAGEECSAYYPAGTAQYHINADIAYSIKQYVEISGDMAYLLQYGAEIVLDTARIWTGIGGYAPGEPDRFCINTVTGPDEYTAIVNNNYYTNLMAQLHLRYAVEVAETVMRADPSAYARIAAAIELDPTEIAEWRRAADCMVLPYDEKRGIHPQDDSFLSKKVWDFAATPRANYPLLLHYHPLVIYRHQVCKQADVVLALLLQGDRFTLEEKRRDFDYYEKITTHDSSLSSCIFSIIAAEVGYADKAYDYFMETARLDLDDTHGNTCHGVHTAAMAGTWLGVACGFGGMRGYGGNLRFAPSLPRQWSHYRFRVHVRGQLLQVQVAQDGVEYRLLKGEHLNFAHRGEAVELTRARPARKLP